VIDTKPVERFAPALGTLEAVTISIRATLNTLGTVTNLTAEPVDLRVGGFSTAVVVLLFGLSQVSLGPAYALDFTDFGPGETRSIHGTNIRGSV